MATAAANFTPRAESYKTLYNQYIRAMDDDGRVQHYSSLEDLFRVHLSGKPELLNMTKQRYEQSETRTIRKNHQKRAVPLDKMTWAGMETEDRDEFIYGLAESWVSFSTNRISTELVQRLGMTLRSFAMPALQTLGIVNVDDLREILTRIQNAANTL